MRLWYKLEDQDWDWWKRQDEISYDYGESITELDVIYGDDEPFFGFQRIQGGVVTEAKQDRWQSVDLAYRTGNPSGYTADFSKYGLMFVSPAESPSTDLSFQWDIQDYAKCVFLLFIGMNAQDAFCIDGLMIS